MTQTLHRSVSEMTEITERTLAATFQRRDRETALYRDCPTAFWLAPGGDEALPPTAGPDLTPASDEAVEWTGHAGSIEGRRIGVGAAMVAAGPIFAPLLVLTSMDGANLLQRMGMILAGSIIALPFTVIVGTILGVAPIAIGTLLLGALGQARPRARTSTIWGVTGAGMGLAIAGVFDAGIVTVPLMLTSIACALIARRCIHWIDAEPALPIAHDGGMAAG